MEPEKTGQSPDNGKPAGLNAVWQSDAWVKGLEDFGKGEAEEKPEEKAESKPAAEGEEGCTTCDKAKKAEAEKKAPETRKPIATLKVKGKDVPVYTSEELQEYAQKGYDYTQKTQAVAEERRKIESERSHLQALEAKMDEVLAQFKGKAPEKATEKTAEPEKSPFEKYGLDPELADDWQKNMVTAADKLDKENKALREQFEASRPMMQMLMVNHLFGLVQNRMKDTMKDFPIEDITDEQGKSLTQEQFSSLLVQKAQANPNKPLDELAAEAVMEIHESQQRTKESATADFEKDRVTDDTDAKQFKEKYPKLFAGLAELALAEKSAKDADLPPVPNRTGKEVAREQGSKQGGRKSELKSLDDFIEEGLKAVNFES